MFCYKGTALYLLDKSVLYFAFLSFLVLGFAQIELYLTLTFQFFSDSGTTKKSVLCKMSNYYDYECVDYNKKNNSQFSVKFHNAFFQPFEKIPLQAYALVDF